MTDRSADDQGVPAESAAEDLDAYGLHARSAVRVEQCGVVLIDTGMPSPLGRFAARVRFSGDVDARVEGVRAWFRERGHDAFTSKLGAHTTPSDLDVGLRAHGAHEDAAEPEHTAMVLDRPPNGASGVLVKVV